MAHELRAANPSRPVIDPLLPLAERVPHFAPKAKQVILLFQYGGPSTFDLLDYKPELLKLNGQKVPESFKKNPDKVGGVFNHCKDELMAGPWKWARHGESGQWVSELLPHTARHIDKLCQVRSMFSESSNRARDVPHEYGSDPRWQAESRFLGDLRARVAQSESPGVCAALQGRRARWVAELE